MVETGIKMHGVDFCIPSNSIDCQTSIKFLDCRLILCGNDMYCRMIHGIREELSSTPAIQMLKSHSFIWNYIDVS